MSDDDSVKTRERFLMWPPQPSPSDSPPPGPDVEITFGARSRRGPLRFQNDDHYMVSRLGRYRDTLLTSLSEDDVARRFDECMYGMVVADGLGSGGETASRLAVSTLVTFALSFGKWHIRIDGPIAEEVMDRVDRFYRAIDTPSAGRPGGFACPPDSADRRDHRRQRFVLRPRRAFTRLSVSTRRAHGSHAVTTPRSKSGERGTTSASAVVMASRSE